MTELKILGAVHKGWINGPKPPVCMIAGVPALKFAAQRWGETSSLKLYLSHEELMSFEAINQIVMHGSQLKAKRTWIDANASWRTGVMS